MMSLEGNATSIWDSPSYLQLPEQPSSRFIDRFIHLKTTYWNRRYAIVLLGFIGLTITTLQWTIYYRFITFMEKQNKIDYSHYSYLYFNMYGYHIGLIPGGILSTIYPAHNILGISIVISSIGHLLHVMSINYLNTLMHCILQFYIGMTMGVVDSSIYRVWTYWAPLNKQSIRHVPIVLYVMINDGGYIRDTIDTLHDTNSSYILTLFIGVIGLAWYVLWLYVINGNLFWSLKNHDCILLGGINNSRHSFETQGVLFTRSIVSEIPWKSICTSKPFLVIVLLYVCDFQLGQYLGSVKHGEDVFEWTIRYYTIVLLLLFVVLVELVPEITVSIPTANVRKFWSCSYFGSMGIIIILKAISGNTITNKMCLYFFKGMHHLYNFGFYVNILDIAPKYASVMYGCLLNIHFISHYFWVNVLNRILSYLELNEVETAILMAISCFSLAVLYAIFASAEPQPWADEPVEENQENLA